MIRKTKEVTERAKKVCELLDKQYGKDLYTYLTHTNPFELLIATILSAQCTDKRVNMVTPGLFRKYPTVHDFAIADQKELEKDIHSIGFYHSKAKNIIGCAQKLEKDFGSEVPRKLEDLISLPGVGRKTVNVVFGELDIEPQIAVDTHVERVSKRLKLAYANDDVYTIEKKLMRVFPKEKWSKLHHQIVLFGRYKCKAINPICIDCKLKTYCRLNRN